MTEEAILREWLRANLGLRVDAISEAGLAREIRRRAEARGLSGLAAFLQRLTPEDELWLLDAATIGETFLFREAAHFELLEAEAAAAVDAGAVAFRVWCAACSSGAEAYSAAAVLRGLEVAGRRYSWDILATDVSAEAVAQAASGRVAPGEMRGTLPAQWTGPFQRVDGEVVLEPGALRRIRFRETNLLEPGVAAPSTRFQVIFARNLAIYLEPDARRKLWTHLTAHLAPGGILVVASSEVPLLVADGWPVEERAAGTFVHVGGATAGEEGADGARSPAGADERRGPGRGQRSSKRSRGRKGDRGGAASSEEEGAGKGAGAGAGASSRSNSPNAASGAAPRPGRATEPNGDTTPLPDDPGALVDAGEGDRALALLEEQGALTEAERVLTAVLLLDRGRHGDAARMAEAVKPTGAGGADRFVVLGLAARAEGRLADGAKEVRRALYLDPRHAAARFHLGSMLSAAGRRAEAAQELERAADLLESTDCPDPRVQRLLLGGVSHAYAARVCRRNLAHLGRPRRHPEPPRRWSA